MIQTVRPIRREVVVPVDVATAFETFTERMTDWWPPAHHIGNAPIAEIVIEPHEGGRWYTRHQDGIETSTGFVTAWEPPHRLEITWQVSGEWRYDPALVTTIEVLFDAVDDAGTRVTLEHRDLDAFGANAEKMREVFDSPDAWTATLTAFSAVMVGS